MATTNKSFKIKNGLIVEGTTGTINGANILTESQAGDSYILNLIGGEAFIKSVDTNTFTVDNSGNLTVNSQVFDSYGAASQALSDANDYTDNAISDGLLTGTGSIWTAIDNAVPDNTDSLSEGINNLYFTTQRAQNAFSAGSYIGISQGTIDVNVANGGGLGAIQGYLGIDRTTVDSWNDASGAALGVQDNLDDHTGASSGVHGVTGSVVGTTDSQDLSNKRFIDTVYFTDGTTIANEGEIAIRSGSHEFDIQANYGNLNLESTAGDVTLTPAQGHHVYIGAVTAANEVATHSYVDNAVSGLDWKQAVHVLYDDSTPTLSAVYATSPLTIDGHSFGSGEDGYRVLITNGDDAGLYVYTHGTTWTLTRSEDGDAYGELVGAAVFVMEGTTYGGSSWVQGNHYLNSFLGQDWTQFSGSGTVTAGTGIAVNGLEVSVDNTIATKTYADDAVDTHSDLTTGVHGVTGDVVGTSDQQTLTNKTIDGVANTISNIANSSLVNDSITVNGNSTELGDSVTLYTDDISELAPAATNLWFTDQRAKTSALNLLTTAQVSNITFADDGTGGLIVTAENGVADSTTDNLGEGINNLYFTNTRARQALSGGTGINYASSNGEIAVNLGDFSTTDLAEGTNLYFTDQKAVDAIDGANITPNTVTIDTYRKEEATQQYVQSASTVTVHSFSYPYESAKYLVRVVGNVTGTKHSQLTEILVTTDGNGNIAITEYGNIHTSDDPLATFSAAYSGTYDLTATTAVSGCEVIVAATMLSWAD